MRLSIPQRDFAAAVKAAARQLPARSLTPILAGLLLEAADDKLAVSGFDLETAATGRARAEVTEPGRTVVPGRLLADIAGSLPGDQVELYVDGEELVVESSGARYALALLPVRDYPALPQMPEASGTVDGSLFAAAVGHTVGAVAQPEEATGSLAGMAGVSIRPDGNGLIVEATDRYLVMQHRLPWRPSGAESGPVVASPRPLAEAARAASGGAVSLALPAAGTLAGLSGVGAASVMRVLDAQFPRSVDKLWPVELEATATVDTADLLAAVRRIALVAEDKTPVLLEFTVDGLTLQAATGAAARGRQRIDAVLEGPDQFRVAFQHRRLVTALAPLAGAVEVGLVTPTRPALIQSADDPDGYRALVMPVRHDWSTAAPMPAAA